MMKIYDNLSPSKIGAETLATDIARWYTFSFFSFHSASSDTPDTLTTLKVTPPISPFALPFLPNPAIKTSRQSVDIRHTSIPSFSSMKLRQPSFGTKLVTLTLTSTRMAEGILLSVLDELNTNAFSYSRIGLFCFNANFLQHNAFTVGSTFEGGWFPGRSKSTFAVLLICPPVFTTVNAKFARCVETRGLSFTHVDWRLKARSTYAWFSKIEGSHTVVTITTVCPYPKYFDKSQFRCHSLFQWHLNSPSRRNTIFS